MGDQPDITVDSAPGMATEDLMERHLRIVSRIKELKKLKAVIDEELTGRLRQETGHRLTFGDVEFKAGAGYRIVSDREGLDPLPRRRLVGCHPDRPAPDHRTAAHSPPARRGSRPGGV